MIFWTPRRAPARSGGSRTFRDVLMSWLFRRDRGVENDWSYLDGGQELRIAYRLQANARGRWRGQYLRIACLQPRHAASKVRWLPLRFVVNGSSLRDPLFTRIRIDDGKLFVAMEVPTADIELMRRVQGAGGWVGVTPGSRSSLEWQAASPNPGV